MIHIGKHNKEVKRMSSAKFRKISETIEMVEIFSWLWFCDPQLKLWVNSIHIIALAHSCLLRPKRINCGLKNYTNHTITASLVPLAQ
jgi:hypothetical protein